MTHVLPIALGALLIAVGIGAGPANAQSFPCRSAHYADEKTVCNDSGLGQLDQELASVYRRVMLRLPRREAEELDKNEDTFVVARRRCGDHRACIEQSYRNRIQELQAALPEDEPDRKSGREARSKSLDRPQASTRDRGKIEDERNADDARRDAFQAAILPPERTTDQGKAKAVPVSPEPPVPAETRSRHDEGPTSIVPNAPSRPEAEAAFAGTPPPEKHARHKHRNETASVTPLTPDRDTESANTGAATPERYPATSPSTAVHERHAATSGGSMPAVEPARPREKRHSKAKAVATNALSSSAAPQEQAKPAAPSGGGTNWVNPAPSP